MRRVAWFSCGAASAVAAKLALNQWKENGSHGEFIIAYIFLENEHSDSMRFLKECEKWFQHPITILKDVKYGANVDNVIASTRYMSGVYGARCTKELKKQVRLEWQRADDIHIFGMTVEEEHRIDRLLDSEPELLIESPLIEKGFTKQDCFNELVVAEIELPTMYQLGYRNNNCIGCLKASGAGYWNKIRNDFPEVFKRRAEQERLLGVALCQMSLNKFEKSFPAEYQRMKEDHDKGLVKWSTVRGNLRIPLRYLPDKAGNHKDLDIGACGFFCESKL